MRRWRIPSARQAIAWIGRDVGGAVVGHHPLDRDPVATVEGQRPAQKADRGERPLVAQHLDVGKTGGVVDADVNASQPSWRRRTPEPSVLVGLPAPAAGDPLASPTLDPPQLLDVDVDELAGASALIAPGWLEPRRPSRPSPSG